MAARSRGLNANTPLLQSHRRHRDADIPLLAGYSASGACRFPGSQEISSGWSRDLADHTPLFVVLLIGVVVMVGALTFLPALALGPIVEELIMTSDSNEDPYD